MQGKRFGPQGEMIGRLLGLGVTALVGHGSHQQCAYYGGLCRKQCGYFTSHLFGNTYSFLKNTLAAFGVECRCCDLTNMDEARAQVDEHTSPNLSFSFIIRLGSNGINAS